MKNHAATFVTPAASLLLLVCAGCAAAPRTPGEARASGLAHTTAIQEPATPSARAYASAEDVNASNNPLNPYGGVNVQDAFVPEYYGYPGRTGSPYTNDLLLRGTLPIAAGLLPRQVIRATVPISTRPDPDGGYTTGLGDVSVFDMLLFGEPGGFEFGAGPLLTMPTASEDELGAEKWSAGVAAIAVDQSRDGSFGSLVQWQTSFAGDDDRQDVELLTVQPIVIVNMRMAWYVRSTATWTFDLENDNFYIPVGFGVGKVWREGGTILNAFVEPQWTLLHDDTAPQFQVFFGLNLTFGGKP